jgi:glycerophosphoryl diester phosphodiesterase
LEGEKANEMTARRRWSIVVVVFCLALAALWAGNTSYFARSEGQCPFLLAHRGVAQTFPLKGVTATTCTASRINPPRNGFIENTIPSMQQAFADGADVVEINAQRTSDGRWAVFHDWTLDCRTNGHGVTRDHTLAYLQTLDVGYGYTADGGHSYPLRGKGAGIMPSLAQVLSGFPSRAFLIAMKSNDPGEGAALAKTLSQLPEPQRRLLMVSGGDRLVTVFREKLPSVRTMSSRQEEHCALSYVALGWTGYVPGACRNSVLLVPANVGPWLWGWPNRFLARMSSAGTAVFLVNDLSLARHAATDLEGIDSAADLRMVPRGYAGGIWTNDIAQVGPVLRCSKDMKAPAH